MEAKELARRSRATIVTVALLSALLNVLVLSGSIYMMLVYDMVIPSRNPASLAGLLVILVVAYAFQAGFDLLRADLLRRWAAGIYEDRVRAAFLKAQATRMPDGDPVKDLDTVRSYLSGPGPGGLMDLPWMILYVGILFLLHPWIGVATLAGAVILAGLAWTTNHLLKVPTEEATAVALSRQRLLEESRGQSATLASLGMRARVANLWGMATTSHLSVQQRLAAVTGNLSGASRTFRMLLQSLILTVGALLVISGKATGGMIFASSIIGARALAPIEAAISTWKPMLAARQAWARVKDLADPTTVLMPLPAPRSTLEVKDLTVTVPGRDTPILRNVGLSLSAGDVLAVVGGSASGKTTLIRAIAGQIEEAWKAVRIDGASLDQWDEDGLGPHLGYLPQEPCFLSGTVMQNISRFSIDPQPEDVIAAASAAGAHEMIVRLQDGYNALMTPQGGRQSGGQRQRIALARALYGNPFLVLLDEPNSNLDTEGEAALGAALDAIRKRGGIAVVASHRSGVLRAATHVLVLHDGAVQALGKSSDILPRITGKAAT